MTILLGLAMASLAGVQIAAGLTLRGLYADGAFYAAALWHAQGFVIIEPARWTAQVLVQAPVVLAMRLGADSPAAVATALSLSTNLMPLALTGASLALLPRRERIWGLFPLFILLGFGMSASIASIADGTTAAAYAWALLLLILLAPAKPAGLAALLLLALGALRLHEAMSFLGPLLLWAAIGRARSAKTTPAARRVLIIAAGLIALGILAGLQDLLHPRLIANRGAFAQDVLGLRWLRAGGAWNALALSGLLGIAGLPLAWMAARARPALRLALWAALGAGFTALALLALLQPAEAASSFAARGNACLASFPAMALLLLARGRRWPPPDRAALLGLTALLCLSISLADAAATRQWLRYSEAVQTVLRGHRGIIGWQMALESLPPAGGAALTGFAWPWTAPLMSLWLAPAGRVRCVIANPPGVVWQPFDPHSLDALLRQDPPADQAAALGTVSGR